MKKSFAFLMALGVASSAWAYQTPNEGTTYTLQALSEISDSGISAFNDGYLLSEDLTVSDQDEFQLQSRDRLYISDGIVVTVEGNALFNPEETAYILPKNEEALPGGFKLSGKATLKNLDIQGGGFMYFGTEPLIVEDCTFTNINDALSGYGVIVLSGQSVGSRIANCTFKDCVPSAINTPSNLGVAMTIEGNTIENVSTSNQLRPFINIASPLEGEVVIRDNVLIGAKLEKPGGIGVSNMLNMVGDNKVLIENNKVTDCSWGLNLVGGMNVRVIGNEVISNRWDTDDNGGIAVTMYSMAAYPLEVYAEGNRFEDNKWGPCAVIGSICNFGKTDDENAEDYNPGNNVFVNNHFTNSANEEVKCDIANSTPNTMYAQGNVWNDAQTAEEAAATIFNNVVDPAKYGPIVYDPIRTEVGVKCLPSNRMPVISGQVEIYTLDGRLIMNADASAIDQLESGAYIIRCGKISQKIVK